MTPEQRIEHAIAVLRHMENDWQLVSAPHGEGFDRDIRRACESACNQFHYDPPMKNEIRRIFDAMVEIMEAVSAMDNTSAQDPDREE